LPKWEEHILGYPLRLVVDAVKKGKSAVIITITQNWIAQCPKCDTRSEWNLEADQVKTQSWIPLEHEGKRFSVRVIKVKLPTGEAETLLTLLNQKQLPIGETAVLYFKRWAVKTSYDLLKTKLQFENFSGKTAVSVRQDFYTTMYLANLVAFMAAEADEKIAETDAAKNLKYLRRSNRNRTIHILRQAFIRLLLEPDAAIRDAMLQRIVDAIALKQVSIVANRSPVRGIPRSKRLPCGKKIRRLA
jgi:hypothetical protein